MRRCSSICQAVCGEPGTFAPRSSGGISANASRQEAWASLVSRYFANCWRNRLIESALGVAGAADFAGVGFDGDFFAVRLRDLLVFFRLWDMIASLAPSYHWRIVAMIGCAAHNSGELLLEDIR